MTVEELDDNQTEAYEYFENQEIKEDSADPRVPMHFDYRFIKSKSGPLFA